MKVARVAKLKFSVLCSLGFSRIAAKRWSWVKHENSDLSVAQVEVLTYR